MDFDLSDDQAALADGIEALVVGRFGRDTVRAMMSSGGINRTSWNELADTGVFGLPVAEVDGGVGLGWADAVVVFEQLGRGLVPGPIAGTALAAGLVDGAISGARVVGTIERPPTGVQTFIEYGEVIDDLVVVDDAGLWLLDPKDCSLDIAEHPLDPLTPIAVTAELGAGERVAGPESSVLWRTRGAVLRSALQLGLAAGATELAVAFAKEREQFGKPIGQFQAIKHLCADMAARVEVARAAVYFAGVALDDDEVGDPHRAASVAAIVASQAGEQNGKDCVQVHGGMGYTWEVDAHLFLKRSWALDYSFGSRNDHAERVASLL